MVLRDIISRAEVCPLSMPVYNPKFKICLKNSKTEVIGVVVGGDFLSEHNQTLPHPIPGFWEVTRYLVDMMVLKSGFSVSWPLENVSLA